MHGGAVAPENGDADKFVAESSQAGRHDFGHTGLEADMAGMV
jgi:hypothetical protein